MTEIQRPESLTFRMTFVHQSQLDSLPYISLLVLLCSTEESRSYRVGATSGWVNDDRISILV